MGKPFVLFLTIGQKNDIMITMMTKMDLVLTSREGKMDWKETMRSVVKETELALYQYPIWKMSIENQKEWETILPSITPQYKEKTSLAYSEYQSSTERCVIEKNMKEIKTHQIENSLSLLTEWERNYIEEKYFNPRHPSDYEVCEEIGISRATVTRLKVPALLKVAAALNIPYAEECLTQYYMKKMA
ncbi:ArpU family phage packaging/lysis transcriptional regulator [Laceyella putida]|uniref:ArpU family phage packaging/lysis transcriptional regulator n=1 Tax=Laceyella putida TaxID=110101 RepID=A0ABW2RQU6_9BACL